MTRITNSKPITEIVKLLRTGSRHKGNTDEVKKSENSTKNIEGLELALIKSISKISKENRNPQFIRKLIIMKVIAFEFEDLLGSAAHLSYISETVERSIANDTELTKRLEKYIAELASD